MVKKISKGHMARKHLLTTALLPRQLGTVLIALQTVIIPYTHANP